MTIPAAIAARRGQAINRLSATIQAISDKYNIEPAADVVMPRRNLDPLVSQMLEVEAIADWLDRLGTALGLSAEDMRNYDAMKDADLSALAKRRSVDVPKDATREQLIAAIRADDDWLDAHDYQTMSDAQLQDAAAARKVVVDDNTKRGQLIAALDKADGRQKSAEADKAPVAKPAVATTKKA